MPLQNRDGVLPLTAADLDSLVLIGPTAGQVDAIGISGERSPGLPARQTGPLAALKALSGKDSIDQAVADDMTGAPIPARLFSHDGLPGLERLAAGAIGADPAVDFTVKGGNALPADSRASWTGSLDVPEAGAHAIRVEISPDMSHAPARARLNWHTPRQRQIDRDAAIGAARPARVAVVFAWARRAPAFVLPGDQDGLIEAVAAVNPNTVVVLNTSQPVALPWAGHVKAILEMWWPGDEGGWATANVLLGRVNPAGRPPVTWARSLTDYPASDPRHRERSAGGVGGRTTFTEGVDVGYRGFDRQGLQPLFP